MLETLLTNLYSILNQSFGLALVGAFAWGMLSVLASPCHLASVPLIIGVIAVTPSKGVKKAFVLSLVFSAGILISIILLGFVTISLGRIAGDIGGTGILVMAIFLAIMGLYLMDIVPIKWNLRLTTFNKKGRLAAFIAGIVFGTALGPCTFAFLAPVLGIAFTRSKTDLLGAALLLAMFAIGHILIIIFAGTLTGKLQKYLDWAGKSNKIIWLKRVCGFFVFIAGFYIYFSR